MNPHNNGQNSRTRMIISMMILVVVLVFVGVLMVLGVDMWAAIIAAGAIGVVSAQIVAQLFGDPNRGSRLPPMPGPDPSIDNL